MVTWPEMGVQGPGVTAGTQEGVVQMCMMGQSPVVKEGGRVRCSPSVSQVEGGAPDRHLLLCGPGFSSVQTLTQRWETLPVAQTKGDIIKASPLSTLGFFW